MNLALISDVIVHPKRQRTSRDPNEFQQLVASIVESGLMHPPVMREESGRLALVAGEGRLKACLEAHELHGGFTCNGEAVPTGYIPYTLITALNPIAAKTAELAENLRREDLSWQDEVTALQELADLEREKAKAAGLPPPSAGTITARASELTGDAFSSSKRKLGDAEALTKYLHHPEVSKAATAADARKIVRRIEEKDRNIRLAASLGSETLLSGHTILNTSFEDWLPACPDSTFDIILTDPPYGMGADSFGTSDGMTAGEHSYEDSLEYWHKLMSLFSVQSFRITKPNAHLYAFCDFNRFHEAKGMLEAVGWKVFRTPLVWHKPAGSRMPWPSQGPQRRYELCLYAVKGDLTCTAIYGDVMTHSPDTHLGHQAQKPVALFEDCLKRSARPGMKILDPFGGTGPCLPAAHNAKCFATILEKDPQHYPKIIERLQALKEKV